ncbi:MAG: D-alanine--D-alanine ligase [Peptococcaceae bacterium]|jgi:D-alanine-D-alanine ligase|nr:D-alanine--D-alanine ligase [Peptococcaceae bacterium]
MEENKKIRVLVIFGGQSGEHEVSIVSANSIINALNPEKYDVQTIGITKEGLWYWGANPKEWNSNKINSNLKKVTIVLDPQEPGFIALDGSDLPNNGKCDIIFPVLHGPKGEDGTVQGLFEIGGIPYVGSGVLGSSLGMDKDRMKAVFKNAELPIVPHITLFRSELENMDNIFDKIMSKIGCPCFIKPANLGSSVGISKVTEMNQLAKALNYAAKFDIKIIVEKGIKAREIELSVLGNENVSVSTPGEIIPSKEFYDYEAKYNDQNSQLIIPAPLPPETTKLLQEYAIKAFKAVDAKGLGRVDFFVTEDQSIFVNEINTMPGFTQISMYPKLWEASGLKYSDLLDELINLGFERFEQKKII